jgi:hypothetical protein
MLLRHAMSRAAMSFRRVHCCVGRCAHDFEISQAVVAFVSVLMVNVFLSSQCAPDGVLHNSSMFSSPPAIGSFCLEVLRAALTSMERVPAFDAASVMLLFGALSVLVFGAPPFDAPSTIFTGKTNPVPPECLDYDGVAAVGA